MTATTATTPAAASPAPRPAVVPRLVSFFSGTTGLIVKIILLSSFNAIAVWAAYVLADRRHWIALGVLAVTTVGVDIIYLGHRRSLPAKFIIPATLFMVAFQIVPILYTIQVALTNYSTGHVISKADAIKQIELTSLQPPANGKTYVMAPARDASGDVVLILQDQGSGATFVGTEKGLTPIPKSDVTSNALGITAATGYTIIKGAELFAMDAQLRAFRVPTTGQSAISPQTISTAAELEPTLRYDAKRGVFVRISDGTVFRDNGKGAFTHGAQELEPGWKTSVGFLNFSRIIHNPLIRGPFLQIFAWTFAYAVLTVFLSFFTGLLLAIALNKSGMRFQRFYRSMVLIPWAMPGFISLLV
jgi:arabinogalactan oligomer/maltooligosaccharide transport system permease protein